LSCEASAKQDAAMHWLTLGMAGQHRPPWHPTRALRSERSDAMLQCEDCEFGEVGPQGEVRLACNPFTNIKEPECLQKWQLLKLDALHRAYEAMLSSYRRMAPLQEKMMKFMEREIDDIDEADKWKEGYEDDEGDESDDESPYGPLTS
jgi:hypothetical protein